LNQVTHFIFKILKNFGIYAEDDTPNLAAGTDDAAVVDVEASITPLMNALRDYRDKVKLNASEGPKTLF